MASAGVTASVTIPRTYNGPAESAHGGYACAVFARAAGLPSPVAVTLLAPPPLEVPLDVDAGSRRATVRAGGTLVATVAPVARGPEPVPPVDLSTAEAAARTFPGFADHPFPTCFVCGHDRPDGSGLRLAPGPVPGLPHTVACPWTPREGTEEEVWSVLDCPGGWVEPERHPMVLSRFSVASHGRPEPGGPHAVVATRLGTHGRTITVGSTVYTATRRPVATATAVWTAVPQGLPADAHDDLGE
ncbi:hypothetical protein [Saccharomonospora cyanea]|uniref:Uncharacterized protein n=1 Tax=Saccharomonospora cyanea NA-134 TaxID=882082 RepID=H5XCU4_9PSEU|nr:hypothetical protein [Saccharomonospora cyanea]EHR62338.1 hypothetical protein SaccyDRAFT_3509 [Saccharomonospora cyanea NA-134]